MIFYGSMLCVISSSNKKRFVIRATTLYKYLQTYVVVYLYNIYIITKHFYEGNVLVDFVGFQPRYSYKCRCKKIH